MGFASEGTTVIGLTQRDQALVLMQATVRIGCGSDLYVVRGDDPWRDTTVEAVRAQADRLHALFVACGFAWPKGRVTVDLEPTALDPIGDLAIAFGLLAEQGVVDRHSLARWIFVGAGIDGQVVLPQAAREALDAFEPVLDTLGAMPMVPYRPMSLSTLVGQLQSLHVAR
jgi:hypothetical protein